MRLNLLLGLKKSRIPIVEISSSHHDSMLNKEVHDEWNPQDVPTKPGKGNLENRVETMENKLERVIKTMETMSQHFLNSRQHKISTFDSPRNLFSALGNDNNMTPTIDRRPKDDTERILQKLCEGEDSVQPMQPFQHSGNNFLNADGLIGLDVPQCLKDMFKPTHPISLSKEGAEIAAYIFCEEVKDEDDRSLYLLMMVIFIGFLVVIDFINKEVVYLDSFPSESRMEIRMRSVKTLGLYMEHLLQDPKFYQFESTPRPLVIKFLIFKPNDIRTQNAESNDCGAWVIMWMVEMGLNGYRIQVDEGTRIRIALDLAMNPYNTLQEVVKGRAENWMKTLDAPAIVP
ncbi:Papain-like cysteine peptidase superfamily [Sesbania bispinosa]|nr:Papain-like cysteine peptidase superfamily [Sesbania bispinosa]